MRWRLLTVLGVVAIATATVAATDIDNGFTVAAVDKDAYTHPAPSLSYRESEMFLLGRSHFKRRWIELRRGDRFDEQSRLR